MYLAYCCAGVGAVLTAFTWSTSSAPPNAPPLALAPPTAHYLDDQFSNKTNIERAILDARAAQKAIVFNASLGSDRSRLGMPPANNRLAAEIQTELQRVGCYSGSIDNEWGRRSRRAMAKLNRAASLDLDENDASAKSLGQLRAISAKVCGVNAEVRKQPAAPNHMTLSATFYQKPKQKVAALDKSTASTSYLPPWMDGAGKTASAGDIDAIPDDARPQIKPKARKATRKPAAIRMAERPRATFPKTSFSFAWPGQ